MPNHHHRAGGLRQVNKKNKRTKSSKRSASRIAGGKVEGGSRRAAFKQRLVAHNKADRRHIQQQKRDAKRQELIRKKRGIGSVANGGGGAPPPRIVGIISLGTKEESTEERLRSLILGEADDIYRTTATGGEDDDTNKTSPNTVTAKFNAHKKDGNLTVLTNSTAFRSQYSSNQNQKDDDDENAAAVYSALDLCRVCDVVVFVIDGDEEKSSPEDFIGMNIGDDNKSHTTSKTNATSVQDWDHLISDRGDQILSAIKSQGVPRAVTVYARTAKDVPGTEFGDDVDDDDHMTTQSAKSFRRGQLKRKADLKKYISRFATTEFGVDNDKVLEVNLREIVNNNDSMEQDDAVATATGTGTVNPEHHTRKVLAAALVRSLCTMSASPAKWVDKMPRAYILSDNYKYDPSSSELHVTGYIRGAVPFDINSLVHIPNLGTYPCKCISQATRPGIRSKGKMMESDNTVLETADPMKRESLESFATPDALDGEQNLVGFDEIDETGEDDDDLGQQNESDDEADGQNFLRPAGWSDYQSAWLDVMDNDGTDNADDFDHGELANELNKKSSVAPDSSMDVDDADRISEEERKLLMQQRQKDQQDHQEFPDEVQVGDDEKARDRFARYRSLKSFRKSYWDPKENLPDTYASIFNFSSFKATQRSVMAEMKEVARSAQQKTDLGLWGKSTGEDSAMNDESDDDDDILEGCVPSGSYITLTIEGVSSDDFALLPSNALLSCVALLPHENKVSVLHMGLSRVAASNDPDSDDVPVKSKDVLTFRCGWRTWTGRPIFSQNNLNCDKHKFERFMPPAGCFFAASVFGPCTYTPCPILVFRRRDDGRQELCASGSMIGPDADRIIVKRIILTGYPVRVHKRFATVKYMFYDPEDVRWFRPAGLTTKHGLNGKIEESVGEHGTMKCLFNAPIKQHDTVCLTLYKRVYPKFVEEKGSADGGGGETGTVRTIRSKNTLVVK